jgi:hypothetical protein
MLRIECAMRWLYFSVLRLTLRPVNYFLMVSDSRWPLVSRSSNDHLSAHIPLFLYPFLNTTSKTRPFEYLRLTSLGVIGALVKVCCDQANIDPATTTDEIIFSAK